MRVEILWGLKDSFMCQKIVYLKQHNIELEQL
jgi:hypothetical protein